MGADSSAVTPEGWATIIIINFIMITIVIIISSSSSSSSSSISITIVISNGHIIVTDIPQNGYRNKSCVFRV